MLVFIYVLTRYNSWLLDLPLAEMEFLDPIGRGRTCPLARGASSDTLQGVPLWKAERMDLKGTCPTTSAQKST